MFYPHAKVSTFFSILTINGLIINNGGSTYNHYTAAHETKTLGNKITSTVGQNATFK